MILLLSIPSIRMKKKKHVLLQIAYISKQSKKKSIKDRRKT